MKVAIITEEDMFYVREFFIKFFPQAEKANYDLSGITILPAFKKSTVQLAKQMYGFYGPYHFVRIGFQYVWKKLIGTTIRSLSSDYKIPLKDVTSVNSDEYINWIKENEIDVIISVAAPEVFKKRLLDAVPHGCINSHSALLPENRGMMPVFWGLFKGSEEIGITIHTMDEKLDQGDIILQKSVPVQNESLHEMILKTKRMSADMMHEVLTELASNGTIEKTPMAEGGSYQTFPTPAEVKEFKKRGKRLF